jgi:hypothetical protein
MADRPSATETISLLMRCPPAFLVLLQDSTHDQTNKSLLDHFEIWGIVGVVLT